MKIDSIVREKAIGVLSRERNVPEDILRRKQLHTLAKYLKLRYPDGSKPHNQYEWKQAIRSWYQTNNRVVIRPVSSEIRNQKKQNVSNSDVRLLRDAAARASKLVKKQNKEVFAKAASDSFLKTSEWRQVRMMALTMYGSRCMCCGATPASGAIMNVDHIKPRKLFPSLALDIDNLQILCNECNHGKGNWDMTDWRPKDAIPQS